MHKSLLNQNKYYSILLVLLQFLFIIILGINSIFTNFTLFSMSISLLGLVLGVWAIWVTRKAKMTILPDVRKGSHLIITGPYKYIRHPMYCSVLLFCLGLLFSNYNLIGSISFLLLFLVLIFKVKYEEKKLNDYFSDYKNYSQKTKKLIPFII